MSASTELQRVEFAANWLRKKLLPDPRPIAWADCCITRH